MIDVLKRLFEQGVNEASAGDEHGDHGQQLAVAALMVEMLRADHQVQAREQQAMARALRDVFALPPAEVDELMEAAVTRADEATSLYEFTRVINDSFDHEQKVHIVEMLWRVAYSDGELEKHEAHLVRRVADLLHLRHREYIGAKLRAHEI